MSVILRLFLFFNIILLSGCVTNYDSDRSNPEFIHKNEKVHATRREKFLNETTKVEKGFEKHNKLNETKNPKFGNGTQGHKFSF